MTPLIPIIFVIMLLGVLANILNKNKDTDTTYTETDRHYDEAVSSLYEPENQSAEEINSQYNQNMDSQTIKSDTKGLMINTLSQLGCQPAENDDGTISVLYQGENFHMEFGGMYARVWDLMWAGIKADDPELPKVREAVNVANYESGPTIVMTYPDDEGVIGFHSRWDIMLHPACPDNVPFVKAILDSFFDTKEQVRSHFHQINIHQMERQKNRRPVGFTTTDKEEKQ